MRLGAFLILCSALWSCNTGSSDEISVFNSFYNFEDSSYGWSGGAADYSVKDSSNVKFDLVYTSATEKMAPVGRSLKLSGINAGGYLTMFIKKEITGLRPETNYTLAFDIELACDTDSTAGDAIILKAGATVAEPRAIEINQHVRLNIDNGLYNQNGRDMIVIDTVDVTATTNEYGIVQSGDAPSKYVYVNAQSDAAGSLWVIIATESSAIGRSIVYYSKVAITFSASNH